MKPIGFIETGTVHSSQALASNEVRFPHSETLRFACVMTDTQKHFLSSISEWLSKACEQYIWWWHTRCWSLWPCLDTGDMVVLGLGKNVKRLLNEVKPLFGLLQKNECWTFAPSRVETQMREMAGIFHFPCLHYDRRFSLFLFYFPFEIVGQLSVSRQKKHNKACLLGRF